MKFKLIGLIFLILFFLGLFVSPVFPVEDAEFRLYPDSGRVDYEQDFNLDILIDTKGEEVIEARAVLSFDPNMIEVIDAERNEELFCDWPEAGQAIDNNEGIVMATGFCQTPPYSTDGEEDVFARLTLNPKREGPLDIMWEYSGRDEPDKSVIISDGSPPQNILFGGSEIDPALLEQYSGDFAIETVRERPMKVPETNIFYTENSSVAILLGIGFCITAVGTYIFLYPSKKRFSKSSTVVVYDKSERGK